MQAWVEDVEVRPVDSVGCFTPGLHDVCFEVMNRVTRWTDLMGWNGAVDGRVGPVVPMY